jgi:hypothetical protein
VTQRLISDFEPELVKTSKKALMELNRVLSSYKEAIILIGGWVPYMLLKEAQPKEDTFNHIGSIDIDWVIDPSKIEENQYSTIVKLLIDAGWSQAEDSLFTFEKIIPSDDGINRKITTDFLTVRPPSLGKGRRHSVVQKNLNARILDSASLAFNHNIVKTLNGLLPNNAETRVTFKMLDVVGCIGTKSIALGNRYKNKDAYDLVSLVDHYGTGIKDVTSMFTGSLEDKLVKESLAKLKEKFKTQQSEGPVLYAEFMQAIEGAGKETYAQRAYMVVNELLSLLKVT